MRFSNPYLTHVAGTQMAMMKIRWTIACVAIIGLCIGAFIGGALLYMGQDRFGPESMEGCMTLGMLAALPLSYVIGICFDWGGCANQWVMFLALVPAANWALVGAAIGLVTGLVRRSVGTKHKATNS